MQNVGWALAQTAANADMLCSSIFDALALLQNPKRLIATLRAFVFVVIADQIRFDQCAAELRVVAVGQKQSLGMDFLSAYRLVSEANLQSSTGKT